MNEKRDTEDKVCHVLPRIEALAVVSLQYIQTTTLIILAANEIQHYQYGSVLKWQGLLSIGLYVLDCVFNSDEVNVQATQPNFLPEQYGIWNFKEYADDDRAR